MNLRTLARLGLQTLCCRLVKLQVIAFVLAAVFMLTLVPAASAEDSPEIEWIHQFGDLDPTTYDYAGAVDAEGNVYVVGSTYGTLPDQSSEGFSDAFVRKYDASGNVIWTHQFGTQSYDVANGISVDASGVYVAGSTYGTLPGQSSAGSYDAFVRKYDASGNVIWTHQFGTQSYDVASGISVDASGVYVAGSTYGTLPDQSSAGSGDAFVRKYDASGNVIWTRQFGSPSYDVASGISVDASGVYVAGSTYGTLPDQSSAGSYDAFVRKYDAGGNVIWTRQFGTSSSDVASGIFVDTSGVYMAGYTQGTFPGQSSAGSYDAFVRKYDAYGTEVWTRQFGTSSYDIANGISADASGVYVAGYTQGTLPEQSSAGSFDAFVRKYDAYGTEVWTRQFGTSSYDVANGISVDASGVYVAGQTYGTFPGQSSAGANYDAFLAKFLVNQPPVADAGADQKVLVNEVVVFDGSASYDEDGSIVSYLWDFGDRTPVEFGAVVSHVYSTQGTYTATLTVLDDDDAEGIDETTITVQTPAEATKCISDQLQDIVGENPGTPFADKIEDAQAKVETDFEELTKTPPDNQAGVGNIEGAVGDLEAAVNDGLLDPEEGIQFMDRLAAIARRLAADALDQAIAQKGNTDIIADAQEALDEADSLRASGAFKDAVNKYKDAMAKAESVIW